MANSAVFGLFSIGSIRTIMLCIVVFMVMFFYFRRPKTTPPGPYGWPLIGSLPMLMLSSFHKEHVHDLMYRLSQKYGNVFSLQFGGNSRVIVLNDLKSVKEAFQKPAITDRIPSQIIDRATKGRGKNIYKNIYFWIEIKVL